MKNKTGITLIALIITIIIMLVLVGVTVNYVANGGLITKAKQAGSEMQIAADKELLEFDVILAMGTDGEINFTTFKQAAQSDGFTVSGSSLPCTATSRNGNEFSISLDGKVTYIGAGEVPAGDSELELLRKYFVGKSVAELTIDDSGSGSGSESNSDDDEIRFVDGTGETASINGSDLKVLDASFSGNTITVYIKYLKTNKTYEVIFQEPTESSGSFSEGDYICQSVELCTGSIDSGSGSGSESGNYTEIESGDYRYEIALGQGEASLAGLSTQGQAKVTTETTALDQVEYNGTYYTVTSVKNNAFNGHTNLALISLPTGITSIEDYAFSGCTNLRLTSLPSGVTSIGSSAFEQCTNLDLTSLPSGVTVIEFGAFNGCTSLALTSLQSGITSIGANAFNGCTNLALTSLPAGVTSIESNAFRDCTNLALTSLPNGVTRIEFNAFRDCTSLALASLPSGVTNIESNAFNGCTNLALTSLPNGVTHIGNDAFYNCTSITQLDLRACTNLSTSSPDYPWGLQTSQIIFE